MVCLKNVSLMNGRFRPWLPEMLSAESLGKRFHDDFVLKDVSFSLGEEETLAVIGPSGCGKSTLLYLLCGLSRPSCGHVLLDGLPIEAPSTDISIILQDYGLLPWKTVRDNVALGLKVQGVPLRERRQRAEVQLNELGIADKAGAYPGTLSGGEQQRVAIARAFVTRPRLMLLDEPFSSLDALTREKLQGSMLDVWNRRRVPSILVTHSLEEAVTLGRRILVLGGRPAHPVACLDNPGFGDPDVKTSPEGFALLRELRRLLEGQ